MTESALVSFWVSLWEHGNLRFPPYAPWDLNELVAIEEPIRDSELRFRRSLPGTPPHLDMAAAIWGAQQIFRTCQFIVYRELEPQLMQHEFCVPCPGDNHPEVHYSVDLSLRFLPEVVRQARAVSQDDPLHTYLQKLSSDWPLSAVGLPRIDNRERCDGFTSDPCLLQLYVDRAIERRDTTVLSDQRVREAVERALGTYGELCPEMHSALQIE